MRTRLFLAAALAVSGVGFVANAQDNNTPNNNPTIGQRTDNALQRTGDAVRNAGDRLTNGANGTAAAPDAEDIRETLKDVAQASLTKGGFDDLVERFVDADRNRLGKDGFTEKDHPELDGVIAQLQQDWKAKYNQDFKIPDKEQVFNSSFATIIQSEIDSARLASQRQNGVTTPNNNTGVTTPNAAPGADSNKVAGGDTNREAGRNIATVSVAASHGLPALNVPMIHEFPDSWKIDVPDTYSAEALHDNLVKQLKAIDTDKAQWPADANEAYRSVTHRILSAVLNVNADASGNMMQQNNSLRQNNSMQPGSTMQPGGAMNPATPAPAPASPSGSMNNTPSRPQ
jgi:hypothetical protein